MAKRPWSVRRYLLLIMAAALVAVAAATVYGFTWSAGKAEDEATHTMTLQARRAAESISAAITDARRTAEGVAAQPGLAKAFHQPHGGCQLTASGTQAFPTVRIDLVSADGHVVCSSLPALAARTSAVHAGSGWLRAALRSHTTLVDPRATDAVTRAPALVVAAPVPGPEGAAGAVAVVVRLSGTGAALAHAFEGVHHAGFTVVRRATGAVASSSDPASGLHSGPRRLFGSADVPGTGWRVYSAIPRSTVLADARGTLTRQALVGLLALLILALAAWLLNRRVAGPLGAIADAVSSGGRERDGSRLPETGTAEITALARAFNTMLDVREGHEAQLVYQAGHDQLTGLPNRVLLREQLDEALRGDTRTISAVLWFGVGRLDVVNDSFGHEEGDRVLVAVAARLSEVLGSGDTLARFDGDQFVVLSESVCTGAGSDLAARLQRCLEKPLPGPDGDIVIHGSIGIADARGGESNPDELLRQADSAMREARRTGRSVCRFDRALQDRATRHLKIEHDIWHALRRDEFVLHYQPLLELPTGRIVGAEALVRWCHPERGMIAPLEFIPIAEQTGQIVPIGRLVLAAACRQAAAWRDAGHPLRVSVNVAVAQLRADSFAADVALALSDAGLSPDLLCLEVTESSLLSAAGSGSAGIEALRRLGVRISIDDFGTGYSSLSYLHQMPVDELKIDRSFVSRLDHDSRDRHLVAAIMGMARALDIEVVAEGVETDEQRELLAGFDCRLAQGYLFSAPRPADELLALLHQGARTRVPVAA
jgi:diguanylate cyclase (GGDEF)-like protein